MSTKFSAAGPALGYLYQARYALYLLLSNSEEATLSIEKADDVAFEKDDSVSEMLQLKHHTTREAHLTDSSSDLWKTLRVWSDGISNHRIGPHTVLSLVTTSVAPDNSIASHLRPSVSRQPDMLVDRLSGIATSSKNSSLKTSFDAFLALSRHQQTMLVTAIQVLDGSPNIGDTVDKIKRTLIYATKKEHLHGLYERLEGWWFGKVIQHLSGDSDSLLSQYEVQVTIRDIADQFVQDALPIDFLGVDPPSEPDPLSDDRIFVQQLREIALHNRLIEMAIRDYYRAFEQRARWVREDLLIDDELEKYEEKLVDEWERFYYSRLSRLSLDTASEDDMRLLGQDVFDQVGSKELPIRPKVSEPYVWRGTYHMLANREQPRVWWHPRFVDRLKEILVIPEG